MSIDPLSKEVSNRICNHMNKDHQNALIAYALHYGGIENPQKARMISIESESMQIEVDGELISIQFDHTLTDSEDAHKTLVAMLKAMPKAQN